MTYSSAREMLEACRSAAVERAYVLRRIERMRAAEGTAARSLGQRVSGTRDPHGMAATDARVDYEASVAPRLAECDALLAAVGHLLFGAGDGDGGVQALMGRQVADVLDLRYRQAMSWPDVAARATLSVRACQVKAAAAIDLIDAHGMVATVAGLGMAEDGWGQAGSLA